MEYTNMGDLICEARKLKNMTQKELADMLNITDKAVSKWERGMSCPDINTIPKLADILGVSADELLRFQRRDRTAGSLNLTVWQKANPIISLIFKAVGIAMGIATLVLSIMGSMESKTAITMLAIGLTCNGIAQLRS